MSVLFAQSVVIVRAPFLVDRYGNETMERDWSRAVRRTVRGLSVQPDSSTEADGDRPSVVTGWRVTTRRGTDLDLIPGDRVEFDSRLLETDGLVARWTVRGRLHHAEARLVEVVG
ncbi:hypothetical protein OU787_17305 [Kitasatospora sp. YST-16]|uniref:hypothetical protein n=1 Tax=Kitasatospora sp. YST-16 TaxID=2998080 RepID=UPI0022850FDA|nr:hypothetical protein [Kitasatospora sp. YST-16]WAL73108.1 hypothetical protein OU787_17305 [Kitasatospora sp. YST-16]WNW39162.1 hypothetical protein RKE32_17270 [Streptomyces sp. Li-HN-5-13]